MSLLFQPMSIRSLEVANRLWVAPMCMYSAEEGVPNDWHHVHLAQFASGGAGLIMAEATSVLAEGRISPRDTGIWNDEQQDAWVPVIASIHARGALAGIQLAHAGRKASTWWPFAGRGHGSVGVDEGGWTTFAPSAIAYRGYAEPRALDLAGIEAVVAGFVAGARRAVDAGFDVLEVHAAHGYLLHQFLSPLSNQRADEYGGSLENRARLLLRIVTGIRAEVGDSVPIFIRFSGTDAAEGGWSVEETATVTTWAADAGADLFDISSGGLVAHQQIVVGPGYQVPLAAHVRRETGLRVSAVGAIDAGAQAEEILQRGDADAIFAAREWLRDPHFGLRAAIELGEGTDVWPAQYVRAARPRSA